MCSCVCMLSRSVYVFCRLYRVVRGFDSTPIIPRVLTKSMLATKSFSVAHKLADIAKYMLPICNEICERK